MIRPPRARDLLLIGLMVFPLAATMAETRSYQKKFAVKSGGTLVLHSEQGDIRLVGAPVSELSIVVSIEGSPRGVAGFTINAVQEGNNVKVIGNSARPWWSFSDLEVVYTIQVPEHFDTRLSTSGGDIEVMNVQGEAEATTSGGDIRFRDTAGATVAKTSGGDIKVERLQGTLNARTSGGGIILSALTGSAEVRTSGGDVRMSQVEGPVQARTSGGDIDLSLADNRGIAAETSGGNIKVLLARDVQADLDVKTFGGVASTNLPLASSGVRKNDEIRGLLNGGGAPIYARTSGGNIRINAAQ